MIKALKSNDLLLIDPVLLSAKAGNVFKFTKIIGERANQIVRRNKRRFEAELDMSVGEIEAFSDQRESISIQYEKQKKPVLEAIEEFIAGDLVYSSTPIRPF